MSDESADWGRNYFNYFTEAEEHFQRARGTGLFLFSPVDWALLEMWKDSGVPLEAVLRGIDRAFEKWRSRRVKNRMVNSLTYCVQAVMEEARVLAGAGPPGHPSPAEPLFEVDDVRQYLVGNAASVRRAGLPDIAEALDRIAAECEQHCQDFEQLEQRLTALEDKMIAAVRSRQTEEDLFQARREFDRQLGSYRGRMTADQIALLERQFLERRLLEQAGLPRLSLCYLR